MRALTPLMLPTSLQPPLTGPRDVAHGTVHRIADEEPEPAAPAPNQPKKGKAMAVSPNQDAVLRALGKKSPADRAWLIATTKLKPLAFDQVIYALNKQKRITKSSGANPRLYGLPGTSFPDSPDQPKTHAPKRAAKPATRTGKATSKPAPESFAAGVKAREREMEEKTRSNGTDLPTSVSRSGLIHAGRVAPCPMDRIADDHSLLSHLRLEATALPCRAIATAAGGAIVLRGNTLTAELSAEEVNVIHQLRG